MLILILIGAAAVAVIFWQINEHGRPGRRWAGLR
jgi:hypothetical protein